MRWFKLWQDRPVWVTIRDVEDASEGNVSACCDSARLKNPRWQLKDGVPVYDVARSAYVPDLGDGRGLA